MPFTQQDIHLNSISIHLLHYEDFDWRTFLSHLTPKENEIFFSFKHEKRQKEYLATRYLRNKLFGKEPILYNQHGAPSINGHPYISISHAKGISGIAVCELFPVGFDIERIANKAARVSHKFLSEREKEIFDQNDPVEMSTAWSAKESLYKLAGRKEIIFKEELLLEKQNNEDLRGIIINPHLRLETNLKVLRLDDTIITINTTACESK